MRGRAWTVDQFFRQSVTANVDGIVKRAETMACKMEREQVHFVFSSTQQLVKHPEIL
jgi:transformation/transcription domain-associated protein